MDFETLCMPAKGTGLPMPIKFEATVRSILYNHTSQSVEWKKPGAKPADDLFYSPKGKRSGTWALRSRERAVEWLKARNLNKDYSSHFALGGRE